ncbi:unnamed protein product [Cylicocyclus nassatus]|uniref:Uncharacterized protein n=1 Tax=Cylicocyclus nassatus TaxID=53992 RepID=A0AA36GYJ3_CYLNA|nr:unnamed protein product [Cylicocyclus nassatus]
MKVTLALFWVAILFFIMMRVHSHSLTHQNSDKKRMRSKVLYYRTYDKPKSYRLNGKRAYKPMELTL